MGTGAMANKRTQEVTVPNDANATGRSFGAEELRLLKEVLDRGILISQYGTVVPELETLFAKRCGVKHCVAVSSGTAALHTAIAAVDPAPGDEIISSPITDMGAVMPIIYQAAIPVFADVEPSTCNVTVDTIAAKITDRTRAVIVTHLFGRPVDMDPIMTLAAEHDLVVIEDAAQAFGATYRDQPIGTIGHIGCFSFQQGKHITCGEGGLVVTNNDDLGRVTRLYHDKGWGFKGEPPDHAFLALNYRMTELQGAVALAQMQRLDAVVAHRRATCERLTAALAGVQGLVGTTDPPYGTQVYWRYPIRIESPLDGATLDRVSNALRSIGARTAPRYTQKLAFEYGFLRERKMFGGSGFPFVGPQRDASRDLMYDRKHYPGAVEGLDRLLCIGWNERYDDDVVDRIATTILDAVRNDGD